MVPRLFFDDSCPVCRSVAKLLAKHLGDAISLEPMDAAEASAAKEFRMIDSQGRELLGEAAIEALAQQVPEVRQYFWMLPPSYRGKALVRTYRFGRWLRRVFGCGSCNQT